MDMTAFCCGRPRLSLPSGSLAPYFYHMNAAESQTLAGRVASLHLHPGEPGNALDSVDAVEVVAEKGIVGDKRYFGKLSRDTGRPSRRQVSLIEREQIAGHAAALGVTEIPPGTVRSNIETTGIKLLPLIGKELQIGEALIYVHSQRDPCAKMDAICQGLRERMMNGCQGVMAEVRRAGRIRVGDSIRIVP